MIKVKRKVKKVVEETYEVELKQEWVVRILQPNGNRTYYCAYEQKFDNEPSEEEIASILAEKTNYMADMVNTGSFASVVKNYRIVGEVE